MVLKKRNEVWDGHFQPWEFVCPCCGKMKVSEKLLKALNDLRNLVRVPLIVSSGYRCYYHNKRVRGAPKSYHLRGMAADLVCRTMTPSQLAEMAKQIGDFGFVKIYQKHIHVDVR